eukprot:SAG22_NODE_428_length_10591_cov_8.858178_3_plen_340_part_00
MDDPPSHIVTRTSSDELTVRAQVAYAGSLPCVSVSPQAAAGTVHWFELRGAATGILGCTDDLGCELNGLCVSAKCVCDPGWTGPTCGTLDVLPAPVRGAYPLHRPNASAPIHFPRSHEPVSWGGTVVKDAKTGKYHGFFDVGCYTADSVMHVDGFQLPHVVGDSPMGPFTVREIAAPPTHFNPHALHLKDGSATGVYVLYSNGGGFLEGTAEKKETLPKCNGGEEDGKHTAARFTHPAGSCNTSLCAIFATSMDGPWSMKNVESVCTNNFVTWQLRNGSILAAGTCGDMSFPDGTNPGNDGEKIWLGIAAPGDWAGPFVTVVRAPTVAAAPMSCLSQTI